MAGGITATASDNAAAAVGRENGSVIVLVLAPEVWVVSETADSLSWLLLPLLVGDGDACRDDVDDDIQDQLVAATK